MVTFDPGPRLSAHKVNSIQIKIVNLRLYQEKNRNSKKKKKLTLSLETSSFLHAEECLSWARVDEFL